MRHRHVLNRNNTLILLDKRLFFRRLFEIKKPVSRLSSCSGDGGDGGDDIAGSGDGGDGGDGGGGSEGEAGTAGHTGGVPTAPHPGDDRGGDTSAVARSGPRGGQSRQRRNQKKMAARRAKAASQTQNAL